MITRAEIRLNPTQYDSLVALERGQYKVGLYIGGRGTGKSYELGVFVYQRSRLRGSVGLLTAPVFDTLVNSTLPGVLETWDQLGLVEGRDYVFGNAPKHWRVRPYKKLRNTNVITWRHGAYTLLDSSDNYNKHRGIELDYVGIDEIGNLKEGAYKVYIGGLRGKASKRAGIEGAILGVGNPPADPEEIETWRGKEGCYVWQARTHENARNLPPGYIRTMADTFSDLEYRRDVLGELVAMGGLPTLPAFSNEEYPRGNLCSIEIDPSRDLSMTWDFNSSSERPMSTVIEQKHLVDGREVDVAVMEFVNLGTDTDAQCELILRWLRRIRFGEGCARKPRIALRGDHTGKHKGRDSTASRSNFSAIRENLLDRGPWVLETELTRPTEAVPDRIAALDRRLCTRSGIRWLLVNPKKCPKLVLAARKLRNQPNGIKPEENEHNDPIAAWSYRHYKDYPVHRKKAGKTKISRG